MIGDLILKIKQFIKEQTCIHNYKAKVWLNGRETCIKCSKIK
jgi:hypothetical protein